MARLSATTIPTSTPLARAAALDALTIIRPRSGAASTKGTSFSSGFRRIARSVVNERSHIATKRLDIRSGFEQGATCGRGDKWRNDPESFRGPFYLPDTG